MEWNVAPSTTKDHGENGKGVGNSLFDHSVLHKHSSQGNCDCERVNTMAISIDVESLGMLDFTKFDIFGEMELEKNFSEQSGRARMVWVLYLSLSVYPCIL